MFKRISLLVFAVCLLVPASASASTAPSACTYRARKHLMQTAAAGKTVRVRIICPSDRSGHFVFRVMFGDDGWTFTRRIAFPKLTLKASTWQGVASFRLSSAAARQLKRLITPNGSSETPTLEFDVV